MAAAERTPSRRGRWLPVEAVSRRSPLGTSSNRPHLGMAPRDRGVEHVLASAGQPESSLRRPPSATSVTRNRAYRTAEGVYPSRYCPYEMVPVDRSAETRCQVGRDEHGAACPPSAKAPHLSRN